jgi:hypothetical protein
MDDNTQERKEALMGFLKMVVEHYPDFWYVAHVLAVGFEDGHVVLTSVKDGQKFRVVLEEIKDGPGYSQI